MANFSLVTVSKGEIKSVDGFIKTFNSIGHNMKVLAVSAYGFMTSEDKDLSIEFGKRVRDELNMSKATLSNLRTAGWLYSLSDVFEKFSYTNVVLFKKNVDELKDENENIDMYNLYKFIVDLAITADSRLDLKCEDLADDAIIASNFLTSLSQKELKNVIDKFNTPVVEAEVIEESEETAEDVEEATEEAVEEATEEAVEEAQFYNIIDDDFDKMLSILGSVTDKTTKNDMFNAVKDVLSMLTSYL